MVYKILERKDDFTEEITKHVMIETDSGEFFSFPDENTNPHYQAWLAEGNPPVL